MDFTAVRYCSEHESRLSLWVIKLFIRNQFHLIFMYWFFHSLEKRIVKLKIQVFLIVNDIQNWQWKQQRRQKFRIYIRHCTFRSKAHTYVKSHNNVFFFNSRKDKLEKIAPGFYKSYILLADNAYRIEQTYFRKKNNNQKS